MKIEVTKLDKLKRKIKIEVSGEEFLAKRKEVYAQNSKDLKVPGFRPQSAPLDMLEKYHGKLLREEFFKTAVPYFYQKALSEHKISAANSAHIYDLNLANDSLVFFAEFEERPEIEVEDKDYKGLKIKVKKIEIKKEEIEKVLNNLKEATKKIHQCEISEEGLARWAYCPDRESLTQAIKAQLFVEKLREQRQDINQQLRAQLLKKFKFPIPRSEAQRYQEELLESQVYNLQLKGASSEDLEKHKRDLKDRLEPLASDEVKLFYILEAVAKKEGIKADNNLADITLGFILSQAEYIVMG